MTVMRGVRRARGPLAAVWLICQAGTLSLAPAVFWLGPDLHAGVPYYGGQPRTEDVPTIKAALSWQRTVDHFNKYLKTT